MSIQRGGSLIATFLLSIALIFGLAAPASAQLATFQTGIITTTPITFDFGNGLSGTVTFTGTTAALSGLYAPTVSGSNFVSNYVMIASGTVALFSFNVPVSSLDLKVGTGAGGSRTDNYVFNTTTAVNQGQAIGASGAALKNQSFSYPSAITSFSVSSSSASPLRVSVQGTSTPVVAPLSPTGATLLGNLVAIGAIVLYRRRRQPAGVNLATPSLV